MAKFPRVPAHFVVEKKLSIRYTALMAKFITIEEKRDDGKEPYNIVINLEKIVLINACIGGESEIIMEGGDYVIRISYRQAQEMKQLLQTTQLQTTYSGLQLERAFHVTETREGRERLQQEQ